MDERRHVAHARLRVDARLSLYIHLAVYTAVNTLLFVINLATTTYQWFWWSLLGWGIGLGLHALALVAIPESSPPGGR
jgi:hypothetical protein